MKHLIIFILLLFISSCCGTKKVIETQPEVIKEIPVTKEIPNVVETPKISESAQLSKEAEKEMKMEETTLPLPPKPPKKVKNSESLIHNRWSNILQEYVSENGKVDYLGIKSSSEFDVYIDILIHKIPDGTWSKKDKLAYWINAYNALTVDLILRNHPLKSIKDIKNPWDQRLWQFGDKWLNLNDIEHKILRNMDEPRIHFAIVCASESCPKLQNEAYTASKLDEQLTNSTKEFLADTSKNEISENNIKLSKIFKWFAKDFKTNGSLIDFLNLYSEVTISSNAKKSFKDYNWDLNE